MAPDAPARANGGRALAGPWGSSGREGVVTMHQRFSLGLGVLVLATGLLAAPALAAPPGNDTWRQADRIRLGDKIVQSTVDATQQRIDRRANRACGAPKVGASVWFRYRASEPRRLVLDASQSGYSVGLMVFRGRPSARSLVSCGPVEVGFRAQADQRYFVMAFADSRLAGGRLALSLEQVRPPTLSVKLDDTAVLDDAGTITLAGTTRCTNASFGGVDVTLRQLVGRFYVIGYTFAETGVCDGTTRELELVITSDNGVFGTEPATVDVFASACGPFRCADVVIEDHPVTVQAAP